MSKSTAPPAAQPRPPVDEVIVHPPEYIPPPAALPFSLPLWSSKYDNSAQPDPDLSTENLSFCDPPSDSIIRLDPANKKDPPRGLTSQLIPNSSSVFEALSAIVPLATTIPPSCYLWELIRREPDQKFSIKVFVNGEWRRVTVSGSLPMDKEGRFAWPCTSNPSELWPGLLSKAATIVPYVPAITLLTGFAIVNFEDFSTVSSGFFATPVSELSPTTRLYNLSSLKPSTYTSTYSDQSKSFRSKTETLLNVCSATPKLILISLDPLRSVGGSCKAACDVRRVHSWTSTTDVLKIVTEGPYHQLALLEQGLYQISTVSTCGFTMAIRSESESAALDPDGQAWTRDPFNFHISNLAGKHTGSPGPLIFTTYFQIAISLDKAGNVLPIISFDDETLEYVAELVSADKSVRVMSGSLIENVAPGSYVLRAFCRSGPDYGVSPGSFSVRILGDCPISCNLISQSNVAKTFSDVFHTLSRDLRIFRETLTVTSKDVVSTSIDVHLEPRNVKFLCTIDNGPPVLGIGHLAIPHIKITHGQKITIDCRLDFVQSWTSWRLRVCPGDNCQLTPSTDRKDKLEALKKLWGESDPGRQERGLASRQLFLNRDRALDPDPKHSNACSIKQGSDLQTLVAESANIRTQYIAALNTEIAVSKQLCDQQFQKFKATLEDQISQRDRYRSKIQQYEALLAALKMAIEDGDVNSVLSKIEQAKSVPSWKVGRCIYQAYAACFQMHNSTIKQAIEDEDTSAMLEALKAAEILDTLPILNSPAHMESVETRNKAAAILSTEALKPLKDAMSEIESRDLITIKKLLSEDANLNEVRQLKLLPTDFQETLKQAQEWLELQTANPSA